MGSIRFGIPTKTTLYLRGLLNLQTFVEGGTYKGATAKLMSKNFEQVITIEKSQVMFNIARKNIIEKNVQLILGDTREHLQRIIVKHNNILFWLDAHWSGGDTYGVEDECPILEEMQIIFAGNINCIILIDDARLFLAPPPPPHRIENWPSIREIAQVIPKEWELIEFQDVIYIFPFKYRRKIQEHFQSLIEVKHKRTRLTRWLTTHLRSLIRRP